MSLDTRKNKPSPLFATVLYFVEFIIQSIELSTVCIFDSFFFFSESQPQPSKIIVACLSNLQRVNLGCAAGTALQAAVGWQKAIGATATRTRIFVKRDDRCNDVYGGNKVRKLEYLLGEALQRNASSVLTFGAFGSNHALATSIHAKSVGLRCTVLLVDQVYTPMVANTLRWHALLGTEIVSAVGLTFSEIDALADRCSDERTYRIAWGGSSTLGSFGFVDAATWWRIDRREGARLPARRHDGYDCRFGGRPCVMRRASGAQHRADRCESRTAQRRDEERHRVDGTRRD